MVDGLFRLDENRHGTLWKIEESLIKKSGPAQGSIGIAFDAESVLAWNRCAWNLLSMNTSHKTNMNIFSCVHCYDSIFSRQQEGRTKTNFNEEGFRNARLALLRGRANVDAIT